MWAPAIHILRVVIGTSASRSATRGQAGFGFAPLHGNAVGAGIGPKIMIEGPVFLHDDDDVLDLRHIARSRCIGVGRAKKSGCDDGARGTANMCHPRPPKSRSDRELDLKFDV